MSGVSFVTGTRREAALLRRAMPAGRGAGEIACAGASAARAAEATRRLLAAGARGLVSFGVAGGLSATLPSGALLLPATVCDRDGTAFIPDEGWRRRISGDLGNSAPCHGGTLLSVDHALSGASDKAVAARETGAIAVDMESAAVGRVAGRAGVPFVVLRVVADQAGDVLPPAALVAIKPDGGIAPFLVLKSLLGKPSQLADLWRLAAADRKAMRTLSRVVAAAPALFFLGD